MAENTVRRSCAFDALKDHDILVFLDDQENQSATIREALRLLNRQRDGEPSRLEVMDKLDELLQKVDELVQLLQSGAVVSTQSQVVMTNGEDQAASEGLDRMMDRFVE